MSKFSHMFTGAMIKITDRKFVAPARGQAICGDKQAESAYKDYCHNKGQLDQGNIYENDIIQDKSVYGDKKVTCPECIKILKQWGL